MDTASAESETMGPRRIPQLNLVLETGLGLAASAGADRLDLGRVGMVPLARLMSTPAGKLAAEQGGPVLEPPGEPLV